MHERGRETAEVEPQPGLLVCIKFEILCLCFVATSAYVYIGFIDKLFIDVVAFLNCCVFAITQLTSKLFPFWFWGFILRVIFATSSDAYFWKPWYVHTVRIDDTGE